MYSIIQLEGLSNILRLTTFGLSCCQHWICNMYVIYWISVLMHKEKSYYMKYSRSLMCNLQRKFIHSSRERLARLQSQSAYAQARKAIMNLTNLSYTHDFGVFMYFLNRLNELYELLQISVRVKKIRIFALPVCRFLFRIFRLAFPALRKFPVQEKSENHWWRQDISHVFKA